MGNRGRTLLVAAATLLVSGTALVPGCSTGYLLQQGWFQAELLAGRVPIDEAIDQGHFTEAQADKLRLVPRIKAFGAEIGLSTGRSYESINPRWKRTIYNVSACDPLAFEPRRWWFPIVGTVPYLGYFREEDAMGRAGRLEGRGLDVHVRTVGAYSTLGWFRDPVLPGMLGWTEYRLAETILHELTHATLWIPGSVQFNESFASFVGIEAAKRYMRHAHGAGSPDVAEVLAREEDAAAFRTMLQGVYRELDATYADPDLGAAEKASRKERMLASIPQRTAELDLHDPARFERAATEGSWNNARLYQFRTYNRSSAWFAALLAAEGGELPAFMARVEALTDGASDPYLALAEAVGARLPEGVEVR